VTVTQNRYHPTHWRRAVKTSSTYIRAVKIKLWLPVQYTIEISFTKNLNQNSSFINCHPQMAPLQLLILRGGRHVDPCGQSCTITNSFINLLLVYITNTQYHSYSYTVKTNLHLRNCPVSVISKSPVALHSKSCGNGLPESSLS